MACKMELKNIISETLNEIEKVAKSLNEDFDVTKAEPSFFKTPRFLQDLDNVIESKESSQTTLEESIQPSSKPLLKQPSSTPNLQEMIESTLKETHLLYEKQENDISHLSLKESSQESSLAELKAPFKTLETNTHNLSSEQVFLTQLQERTLVLFEGMRALKNEQALERLDLVVRFLEYQLSMLERRLKLLEHKD